LDNKLKDLKELDQNNKSQRLLSQLYFWGLILLVVALPLSRFMMSVAQFSLSSILILQFMSMDKIRHFNKRFTAYQKVLLFIPYFFYWAYLSLGQIMGKFLRKENLPAIVFTSLYVLHVIGLLFSVDFDYALKDLRIKLPLLVLPIIFTVSPLLDKKKFRTLMLFFATAVIAGTLISTYILLVRDIGNLRDISIFISHIRFGLLISIAIFIMGYYAIRDTEFNIYIRLLFAGLAGWLMFYLLLSASMTGMVVLFIAVFVMAIHYTLKKKNLYSRIITVVLILTPIILLVFIMGVITDVYKVHRLDLSALDKKTELGNYYWHDTTNLQTENGYYVWIYIATNEVRGAWNEISDLDFDGNDNRGQELKHTLFRYMTSKGLRKDAAGVAALTPEDVALIEEGEASSHYDDRSVLYIRLYKIIWETQQYFRTGNPSGHSAMQRIEYWKTSWLIIKQHPLIGVGTGDMNIAFEKQYEMMDSPLEPEFRWRSHNQFLSIAVGFGIVGILWFLFALLYPPIKTGRLTDYFYLSFFIIILVSMLSEDTIETQTGVTLFALFTSLFLFGKKDKTPI